MRVILLIVSIMMLSACGGGGVGTGIDPVPTDYSFDPRGYWTTVPEGDFEIRGARGAYTVVVGEGNDTTVWQMFVTGANSFRWEGTETDLSGTERYDTLVEGTFTSPKSLTANATTRTNLTNGDVEIENSSYTATWQSLDGSV